MIVLAVVFVFGLLFGCAIGLVVITQLIRRQNNNNILAEAEEVAARVWLGWDEQKDGMKPRR